MEYRPKSEKYGGLFLSGVLILSFWGSHLFPFFVPKRIKYFCSPSNPFVFMVKYHMHRGGEIEIETA